MDVDLLIGIFPQVLLDGITLGFMYALIALGYTMVYGVLEFINFAHSEIFILGSFVGAEVLLGLLDLRQQAFHGNLVRTFFTLAGHAFVDGNVHQAGFEFPLLEDFDLLCRLEVPVGDNVLRLVEDAAGIGLCLVLVDTCQYDLQLSMSASRRWPRRRPRRSPVPWRGRAGWAARPRSVR
jgi:hypothetical protein